MAKKAKKATKKRAADYNTKLKVNGTFDEVLKASIKAAKKK